ncbi:MAG: TonB family protein [Acidobacteria bacterium]|nr:TonB family protein [Acidobacteriota bacterium]MBI3664306.1 TonB family protein [Acidobacteriota bacterium]
MRRLIGTLALLALFASLSLAQRPEETGPRLEPVEIVSTAELYYPITSVAFGTVVLQVTVDSSGAIEDIKVIKDIKSLTPEAVKCVKQWKFRPARLDGKPVRSTIAVAFTFINPYRPYL